MNGFMIIYGAGMFLAGRFSLRFVKDRMLEEKRLMLLEITKELQTYHGYLVEKDKEIRKKWQNMVSDFSRYQAAITPEEQQSVWTETDDIYLSSWKSAEE